MLSTAKCLACNRELSIEKFSKRKNRPIERNSRCSSCNYHINKSNIIKKGKDFVKLYHRKQNLKKQYGLTIEQYDKLFIKFNNKCCICKKEETAIHPRTKMVQPLSVDHNHITKKVRGLLCNKCNHGIGSLKVDEGIELLESAIVYIKGNQ